MGQSGVQIQRTSANSTKPKGMAMTRPIPTQGQRRDEVR